MSVFTIIAIIIYVSGIITPLGIWVCLKNNEKYQAEVINLMGFIAFAPIVNLIITYLIVKDIISEEL